MYDKDEIKQNITIEQMIDIVEALGASTLLFALKF